MEPVIPFISFFHTSDIWTKPVASAPEHFVPVLLTTFRTETECTVEGISVFFCFVVVFYLSDVIED